ncbi:unnamed protein product [Choristocarpus tenellus]
MDLACLQASATLRLMSSKEEMLKDLSLTFPFQLIEMPAVVSASWMEYCGISAKVGRLLEQRREVDQRLKDLRGVAEQVTGGTLKGCGGVVLSSSKQVHDTIYLTLRLPPPPTWTGQGGGRTATGGIGACAKEQMGTRRGGKKQALIGPTDTTSLEALLARKEAAQKDPHGFVSAVIQHRSLQPVNEKLSKLLRASKRHPHLGGTRVHPTVDLFTSTGRMVTSDPPLQTLNHKIYLRRSWRTSLAVEMEAGCLQLTGVISQQSV